MRKEWILLDKMAMKAHTMTCDEARNKIHRILVKMADYQWRSAQEQLSDLYRELTETPADIHRNYNWYEGETK